MRKIIITDLASEDLKEKLEYINLKFGKNAGKKFSNKVNKSFDLLVLNPEIFPKLESNSRMRKCVITKQSTAFYTFDNYEVKILAVFDNRQSPTKIDKIN